MKWLDAIEERCAAATAGPWVEGHVSGQCNLDHGRGPLGHGKGDCQYDYHVVTDYEFGARGKIASLSAVVDVVTTTEEYGTPRSADVRFIAASRTDVPRLLRVARAAEALEKAWQEYRDVYYAAAALPPEQVADWAQGCCDAEAAVDHAARALRSALGGDEP